jgi:mRNA interferase RelE/StbE
MADYEVTFARSARRELEALDSPIVARIITRIESLAGQPRPAGSRKLHGAQDLWRIRVGDYRVVYAVDDRKHTVDVVRVRHRRDAYR